MNYKNELNDCNQSIISINDVMHRLHVVNYLTPTYCDYCSQLLFGLIKQGLRCEICGQNFHKRCIEYMPKICNKQLNDILSATSTSNPSSLSNGFVMAANMTNNVDIEHTFLRKECKQSDLDAVKCDHCKLKIDHSNSNSFLYCKDCHVRVHSDCSHLMAKNCKPFNNTTTNNSSPIDDIDQSILNKKIQTSMEKMSIDEYKAQNCISDIIEVQNEDSNDLNTSQTLPSALNPNQNTNSSFQSRNFRQAVKQNRSNHKRSNHICLQRLSQRIKKSGGYFWSGYMFYYTKEEPEFTTHYWKLDSNAITIYDSYRLEKKLKEIPLANIKRAYLCGLNMDPEQTSNSKSCLFVMRTESEAFFCGSASADQNSTMNVLARNFYNIFKMVYLPYMNRNGAHRKSLKITAPKYEEKNLHEEYIINPKDLLGSGQFGQVYGGVCKANGQTVAIKVIDKTRFRDFQAETSVFQNEITILYNVQHPGIVKLFALFDEVDHLYIVTEKMSTDMLEMILSKSPPRLPERNAKFIIYQILIALAKLHERNIAHCDLKPENILLTENVSFPQVKICDFGYAKIIGENSFRRSMVGTPAYSPPELKQKRVYNNSIDMWSMGVIVYVTLSGTFPFEDDRDIYEQVINSNFMFPADPWESISADAIDLINQLLQVKIDRRMSTTKALQHKWFSHDQQLHFDLVDLENRVNLNWLTNHEHAIKWKISTSF